MNQRIAIIGAGYAGLAAGVSLAKNGQHVTVFETSRVLGGRARQVELGTAAHGQLIADNGQHILIGAYSETLRLLEDVGISLDDALLRLPLNLNYPGHFSLAAPHLPAPLHLAIALLAAKGLSWSEKFAAIRLMNWLKKASFKLANDITVTELLDQHQQPPRLRQFMWDPLCISALNTPADQASAQVFANVLRDSLAAHREASDLLIPKRNLSALFAEPAANFIVQHGGEIKRSTAVTGLQRDETGFVIYTDNSTTESTLRFDQVIIAVAPYHLPRLLSAIPELAGLIAQVDKFKWEPIVTCYQQYPAGTRLPGPMLGLSGGYGHWVFDRGQLSADNDGLFATVISAKGQHQGLDKAALSQAVHDEIKALMPDLPDPLEHWVITEKRATFACTPNLDRPQAHTALKGLWLAGDYVASDYPATIEGAIRSGLNAATAALG